MEVSREVPLAHTYVAFNDFDSNMLCVLHSKRMLMVEIATNPKHYRVHAGVVLGRYAPEKNLGTPARYHILGHIFNLDILLSYCSLIGPCIRYCRIALSANIYYSINALWTQSTTR